MAMAINRFIKKRSESTTPAITRLTIKIMASQTSKTSPKATISCPARTPPGSTVGITRTKAANTKDLTCTWKPSSKSTCRKECTRRRNRSWCSRSRSILLNSNARRRNRYTSSIGNSGWWSTIVNNWHRTTNSLLCNNILRHTYTRQAIRNLKRRSQKADGVPPGCPNRAYRRNKPNSISSSS